MLPTFLNGQGICRKHCSTTKAPAQVSMQNDDTISKRPAPFETKTMHRMMVCIEFCVDTKKQ